MCAFTTTLLCLNIDIFNINGKSHLTYIYVRF